MQTIKANPKIGLMAVGCHGYWGQFPGIRDYLESKHKELYKKFVGAELICAGIVDTAESSKEAGLMFAANDVDIVFCQAMTYSPSDTIVPAVQNLNVPVILLNIQESEVLELENVATLEDWLGHGCTCAGLAELSAMLNRYEKTFDIITGFLNGDATVDEEIAKWISVAAVRRRMKTHNIGLLGRQYPGMMDLYVDENAIMKKFGMMTKFLMWEEVLRLSQEISAAEKAEYELLVRDTFEIPADISRGDIENIAVMYGAYRKLADKYSLAILANHFERETTPGEENLMAALNPAHTILQKNGMACTVEGDIKGAIAMLILKTIAGSANLTELYSMDFKDDICLIGHSGASDPAIAAAKPVLKMATMFHGKSGKGYTTQVVPDEGPLTMLALTMRANGEFKMIAAEGRVENGAVLQLGDTNSRVRFGMPMRDFVNEWSAHGPSHHGVMGKGHHIETLEAVAKMLDIELEVVARHK